MLLASPVRALAGALFVAAFFTPKTEPDTTRARATETHTLETHEELVGSPMGPPVEWALRLEPVLVESANTRAQLEVRLYRDDGEIDGEALDHFVEVASEVDDPHAINARTIQLAFKAAYHFKSKKLSIVSAWRPGRGPHTAGDALDFRLSGVGAGAVASYLRKMPRAGVGIYTNPQTQYVHLDARDQSFHWLDASPPGKTWREKALADGKRDERDASWAPEMDLPDDHGAAAVRP